MAGCRGERDGAAGLARLLACQPGEDPAHALSPLRCVPDDEPDARASRGLPACATHGDLASTRASARRQSRLAAKIQANSPNSGR